MRSGAVAGSFAASAAAVLMVLVSACGDTKLSTSGAQCRVVRPSTFTAQVPKALRACSVDNECTVVVIACCGCMNAEVPARADSIEVLRNDHGIGCPPGPRNCPLVVSVCAAEASRCIDGICELCGPILD